MSQRIKILDCTLRDGGYVNNWEFGKKHIPFILKQLNEAGIDIIECGFLTEGAVESLDSTIFSSLTMANQYALPLSRPNLACMINYGSCSLDYIPNFCGQGIDTLRVAFHRKDLLDALSFCEGLQHKGYKVFLQPMATSTYSEEELGILLRRANDIHPYAVYIVDSYGTMQDKDVLHLLEMYSSILSPDISIGFHSHNNLQLSFPNSVEILKKEQGHEIIIDSSVYGMGRGAGNLCSELIIRYLNEHYGSTYQLVPILEIIDDCLNAIFIKTPWGYSVPFYVASIHGCHPNYATYLVNKQTLGVRQINIILSKIPEDQKKYYNKELIEQLYVLYQTVAIDDTSIRSELADKIHGHDVLMLAPGKSLLTHRDSIVEYIQKHNPFVIAVNFIPEDLPHDLLFISNCKRFKSMDNLAGKEVLVTSNLHIKDFKEVDYTSLICAGKQESDNAGLMLMRLLYQIGLRQIWVAGYDGFSENIHDNYVSDLLINNTITEIYTSRNKDVAEQLCGIRRTLDVQFLTPSKYV